MTRMKTAPLLSTPAFGEFVRFLVLIVFFLLV